MAFGFASFASGFGLVLAGCDSSPSGIPDPGPGDTGTLASGGQGSGGAPAASGGGPGSGGAAAPTGLLIDDFEDRDDVPAIGSSWYSYFDVENGGLSTGSVSFPEPGYNSAGFFLFEYTFDQGELTYDPYVGTGISFGTATAPMDLSAHSAITYVYQGDAHTVRLQTSDVIDYDYHGFKVAAASVWTTVDVPFALLSQEGWGEPVAFDPTHVRDLTFHITGATGQSGSLSLDDLYLGDTELNFPLTAQDPAPPTLVPVEPLAIENPLQQVALDHLSKGVNLDSWLEAGRFEGFDYDEAYVQKLAAAGFESLRLPIDLDLYVESVSGTAPDLQLALHDDLFTILDSFEAWTAASGMSLTIDYHQYDRSLDFARQDTKDLAVALWRDVAAHFADNPREDLFYELLNEPELSVDGTPPTSEEWTALAEEMIAAIRATDTTHTILFGDVEWYGITPLAQRMPLSDDNVIYVFHFYDPFIFSHQGAGWTDLSAVHDIPYPYQKERWPENGVDLGITNFLPSWVITQVRDYYKTGNKNWMYNRIGEAKQWAVDNNVPVICNEFGIYEAASQRADRVAYYTDLIDVFEEQEIPWQVWFRIMDDEGVVIPEYRTAFGLDP